MEKLNFVKNGVVMRLPPGFRFHPMDEELLVQYLKKKVCAQLLPANIIHEVDVFKIDPWDLPGNLEEERFFFSRNESKYVNSRGLKRATRSGYWKATGIDKRILSSKNNEVVGMKKTLVFYRGKPCNGDRTEWIMHEYRLKNSTQGSVDLMKSWVVCRIFSKKRGTKNGNNNMQEMSSICEESSTKASTNEPVFYNFMKKVSETDLNLRPPLSSSSSGVTEISCDEQEESSSGGNSCSFQLTRRRL